MHHHIATDHAQALVAAIEAHVFRAAGVQHHLAGLEGVVIAVQGHHTGAGFSWPSARCTAGWLSKGAAWLALIKHAAIRPQAAVNLIRGIFIPCG